MHFDDSLQTLVRSAAFLAAWAAGLLAAAIAMFVALDHTARSRWRGVALSVARVTMPYRSATFVESYMKGPPLLVRAASLSCFGFGLVFVPGLVFALTTFRFDGLGVALIPGIAVATAVWLCGILLLRRSPIAPEAARTAASVSLVMNVALVVLSGLHLAVVDAQLGGTVHECSASVALTACLFATLAVPQALLMLAATRRHGGKFKHC
jgi:hypothetical protein